MPRDRVKHRSDEASHEGNGSNHESVEEAVFKYVGVGLQNDDDAKGGKSYDGQKDENDEEVKVHNGDGAEVGGTAGGDDDDSHNQEMDWLFRHAQEESTTSPGGSNREPQSVALAAVAAAYASSGKRSHEERQTDSGNGSSSRHGDRSHKHKSKSKHKKAKLQLAVDPELATLDDTDITEHDQLVRKAIIDTNTIAQHPDFQQYLNTEHDPHRLKDGLKSNDKSLSQSNDEDHEDGVDVSKTSGDSANMLDHHHHNDDDDLDDVTKQYSELQKQDGMENSTLKSLQKKDYREVLPKVMSSSEISVDTDVSHLIQSAASKASEIIGSTAQSSGKSFDGAEEAALEQFITEYQTIKNLDRQQICERIWSNERRKDDFWSNICKVLPYRTRSSIYKHVRRKYHIFEQRGKWTAQEDRELARLCIEKEGQWSEIGKALGRMPEDCRDRWRNYVKCGSNRASNKWSLEEEELLKRVISEMLDEAQRSHHAREDIGIDSDEDDEDDGEKKLENNGNKPSFKDAINWTVVSERMGGTRSRIQCRYKWNKLVKKEAIAKIQSIGESEKRWIMEKLRDLGFTEDSQVDWEELATLKPGPKWTGTELKLCYERMRSGVRYHKQKSINEISKELLGLLDGTIPLDSKPN
ncbi:hypothetical protein HG535_0C01820 [Zygotorulaspora mrakii]|uniref:DNA-binding protein REB1 n=1 Tax=Zygotorulaspora mrakii TaxID=42260 RepID=A0A7H9B017_ZYGMR|nr:uncharacterized protein HG535_0C01820 [Zygotorulaspora mrakii]QLG71833.1 hypothetical protein HG535_0C01820 [Zygotorulaspora mrakii]